MLFKSFTPAIFFLCFYYFLWRSHGRCSPGKFMIMSHHAGYYFKKPFRLPITFTQLDSGKMTCQYMKKKKMACHYFLKTDLVSGSWSVKIVHVLLKFPYTWPNVASRRKIYFPVFSFQAFLGSWSRRKWNCRNECTLLFRLEPLYSSLFLLCLMYAKLTKK